MARQGKAYAWPAALCALILACSPPQEGSQLLAVGDPALQRLARLVDVKSTMPNRGKPFVARFKGTGASLVFIAANHAEFRANGAPLPFAESETRKAVDRALKEGPYTDVVVEASSLDPTKASKEAAYTINAAKKVAYPLTAGELDRDYLYRMLVSAGVAGKTVNYRDIFAGEFLSELAYALSDDIQESKIPKLFDASLKRFRTESEQPLQMSFDEFKTWLKGIAKRPYNLNDLKQNPEVFQNLLEPNHKSQFLTSAIAGESMYLRDHKYARTLLAHLKKPKAKVLIVIGGFHFVTLRPVLEAALGKADVEPVGSGQADGGDDAGEDGVDGGNADGQGSSKDTRQVLAILGLILKFLDSSIK